MSLEGGGDVRLWHDLESGRCPGAVTLVAVLVGIQGICKLLITSLLLMRKCEFTLY